MIPILRKRPSKIWQHLREDIACVLERDPAAHSSAEVVLCYPGLHAVWLHRLSHALWQRGWRLVARCVAHTSRAMTGIEIHPGAKLGRRLFIDHGMGVVIGETAEVGDDCTLYQGVTLGGTRLHRGLKRHPTLEDNVVVGAGAKILGGFTIGAGARIGSNSVVTQPVPAGATAVGIPARLLSAQTPSFVAYGVEPEEDGLPSAANTAPSPLSPDDLLDEAYNSDRYTGPSGRSTSPPPRDSGTS